MQHAGSNDFLVDALRTVASPALVDAMLSRLQIDKESRELLQSQSRTALEKAVRSNDAMSAIICACCEVETVSAPPIPASTDVKEPGENVGALASSPSAETLRGASMHQLIAFTAALVRRTTARGEGLLFLRQRRAQPETGASAGPGRLARTTLIFGDMASSSFLFFEPCASGRPYFICTAVKAL